MHLGVCSGKREGSHGQLNLLDLRSEYRHSTSVHDDPGSFAITDHLVDFPEYVLGP